MYVTAQGGFSAVPGTEAHGGYTFCGFASLILLHRSDSCDLHTLLVHNYIIIMKTFNAFSLQRWVARKQMKLEGGFQVDMFHVDKHMELISSKILGSYQ